MGFSFCGKKRDRIAVYIDFEEAVRVGVGFLGLSLDNVLSLTPQELFWASEARSEVVQSLHETIISANWLSAALTRQKKIPNLKQFLLKKKKVTMSKESLKNLIKEMDNG